MGAYDDIGIAIGGQKASASQFGVKVRNAIIDLDRRVAAYDTTNQVGKAFSTSSLTLSSITEVAALTITGVVFKAGLAYEATMRQGIWGTAARLLINMRVRKFNATPGSGADWGEYYRFSTESGASITFTMGCFGQLILINNTAADITSDVNLTAGPNAATQMTIQSTTATPRYFTIKPCGFAVDFVGLGVQVS